MQCQRCNGMMISERFYGPGDPFWGWRCFRCGEIFDPIILENRSHCAILAVEGRKGTSQREKREERKRYDQLGRRRNAQVPVNGAYL